MCPKWPVEKVMPYFDSKSCKRTKYCKVKVVESFELIKREMKRRSSRQFGVINELDNWGILSYLKLKYRKCKLLVSETGIKDVKVGKKLMRPRKSILSSGRLSQST